MYLYLVKGGLLFTTRPTLIEDFIGWILEGYLA
jgi:hypothetical protein